MEVAIPFSDNMGFEFNSARSTPFHSPPCTPKPFNGDYYFSAPPSPTHMSDSNREFESLFITDKAGDDFAFDVSQELEKGSVSAEELFDGGMIKPLKPTPVGELSSRKSRVERESREKQRVLSSSSRRRSARSLSPMRSSKYLWEEQLVVDEEESSKASLCSSSSSKGSKKWRFKDLFLFRSASEGRASDKDPLKKYTAAVSSSSSNNKAIVTTRRKKGQVSAQELHYTMNKAVSSDLKKRTFLPYKQGFLYELGGWFLSNH